MGRQQHHQRYLRSALEELELRAMLAASVVGHAVVKPMAVVTQAIAKPAVVHPAITAAVTPALVRGDFNFDGHVDGADILPALRALVNVSGFQQANNLTNAQLLAVADVNKDGVFSNADLQ